MNSNNKIVRGGVAVLALIILLTSCNKLYTDPVPIRVPANPSGNTLAKTLASTPGDSLYNRLVIRSGILTTAPATITDSTLRFTMFVPDNNAMKVFINALSLGAVPLNAPDAVFSGFITANIPVASAAGIVGYNIVAQVLTTASFPTAFPNLQYPTILNPAPTLSALLRLTTFPSKRGSTTWVNNVPLSAADAVASNGIIHHVPAMVLPPNASLWVRISTDPDMTYFKAAVLRADSGTSPSSATSLQGALDNIGANLTVFVPTDSAMRAVLTQQITGALIAQGYLPLTAATTAAALASTPAVFSNPLLYTSLTVMLVKGLVAYHILGTRVFTVNLPTTATNLYTLVGGAPYPGVSVQASFTGPVVTAASVKGAANASPSVILLDPTPYTGKSDQNATNGVLHKINQALLPQ
ncbi:MAG: hypothetical protein ABI813_13190 [Bacteroidota bacterium]